MKGGGALLCPPGFWCMDTTTVLFSIFVVLLIVGGIIWAVSYFQKRTESPTVIVVESKAPAVASPREPTIERKLRQTNDPRFHPLSPEQSFFVPPDTGDYIVPAGLGALPINTQSRGYPGAFQQMGALTAPGGTETSGSPTRTILPLFGRPIDPNRNRWNYYTRTDGINPVQVPLQFKRRNCEDDNGCDEITDGDSVGVPILGQSYIATTYRYSTPRYIPVV